ncbi:MAG TPA: hypothetical protein VLB29_18750 [Nocardioidaceae bacterium]|nr:hypothetical protein [Nocardioidaceae bacterium]
MSVARPRGPLPARVYWVRRVLVLVVVCGLVFGIGRLLGGGSGGAVEPSAQPASAVGSGDPSPSAVSTADAQSTVAPRPDGKPAKTRTRVPLAMPTGPCQDEDVRVVPTLEENAYAGGDIRLTLRLTTIVSPACTWEVSAESVAVKLTSGSDRIWSTQDCPGVVPEVPVVLRDRKVTLVDLTWSGRRSDSDCSRTTQWAEPGYYHVAAAAMGSDPTSQQFQLLPPAPVTITPSPTPRQKAAERGQDETGEKEREGDHPQESGDD